MPDVKLIAYIAEGEKLVASAAKQSISRKPVYPDSLSDDEVEKWIIETFRRQHWSPWEFSWYVFLVTGCSRVCTHQLVRHRIASYVQLSQRYSAHVLKDFLKHRANANIENAYIIPRRANEPQRQKILEAYAEATEKYIELVELGLPYEDARYVLPQGVKSHIYVAMNARELATVFLPLRMCSRAQWEIREIAWKMWRLLVAIHPRLFKYVGPRCIMLENTLRDKPCPLESYIRGSAGITVIPRCPELVPRECILNCIRGTISTLP